MRICIIAPAVIPVLGNAQKYGGIETVISIVANELVSSGHEVYLFAPGNSRTKAQLIATTPKGLGQGTSFNKEQAANIKAYKLAMSKFPDVIWDHTLSIHSQDMKENKSKYTYNVEFILKSKQLFDTGDIPVVHTLHGPAQGHLPKLVQDLSKEGHYFVSISKDQAKRYLRYIHNGQHLGTVYNPIDTKFYKANYNKRTNSYLFWAGRYCMEKGPHIALSVAHQLNIPIKFIGKKVEPHEIAYFNEFIKPNLWPQDEVLGLVSAQRKAKLFRGAKATMMTNIWPEPFGIVAAESMSSGTPVVGPALGSLSELIDSAGVLIPVKDLKLREDATEVTPNQTKYINRIVSKMKIIDSIPAQVARKRAEFLFSPKQSANGYEEAFYKAAYLQKSKSSRVK